MTRLVRTFCLMLAVALMASMMLHEPSEARDQAEHMADEIAAQSGVEVKDHSHPDCSENTGDIAPGHHHHSGGDTHSFAVSERAGLVLASDASRNTFSWPQDMMPNGLASPGPDQPPKQTRAVI